MIDVSGYGFQKTALVEVEKPSLPSKRGSATGADVRRVLLASATRVRNLSTLAMTSALAMVMLGLGMTASGLGILGFGAMLYGCLIAKDALDEEFLTELFALGHEPTAVALPEGGPEALHFEGLEVNMRDAYEGILTRRKQLQERFKADSANLQASLPEGIRICDTLLTHAQRLVARGQRLHAYLECTRLRELTDIVCSVTSRAETAKDLVAAKTYRQVISGRRRHIETHIEVEGLYDRVLAQLMLIETTLAGTIAQTVKITAADDEESSLTASLITEELEHLIEDVKILELSLDEVCGLHDESPAEVGSVRATLAHGGTSGG